MPRLLIRTLLLFAVGAVVVVGNTRADPGYYLVSVYESQGEARLDFRFWAVQRKGVPTVVWPEIGLGYGVTKRWYTEVLASYIGSATRDLRLSNLQWQNDFLLTQGQFDVDVALHTLLLHDENGGGSALEFGPALQTEWGRMRFNANLILERPWGLPARKPTQFKYQWQAVYRWKPQFQFGLQGFGELGEWDHWAASGNRSQRLGPVVQGTLPIGPADSWHYQLAYLGGKVYGKRAQMLSARVYYTF